MKPVAPASPEPVSDPTSSSVPNNQTTPPSGNRWTPREGSHLTPPPDNTPPLYGQDGKGYDATVYGKYRLGSAVWLVTEYDPETSETFGWVCLTGSTVDGELGYGSLSEMDAVELPVKVRSVSGGMFQVGSLTVESVPFQEGSTLEETIRDEFGDGFVRPF